MEFSSSSSSRIQRSFNSLAVVQSNLRQTTASALSALEKIAQRGEKLEDIEKDGSLLEETSRVFASRTMPWWKRLFQCHCLPRWWFKKQKTEEESDLNFFILLEEKEEDG